MFAYIHAEEIATRPQHHQAAFARYQDRLKHYVEVNQALAFVKEDVEDKQHLLDEAKWAISLDDPASLLAT